MSLENRKARATVALLALSPEGCADRGSVSALLWSDSPDPKANLRQVIRDIRTAFSSVGHDCFSANTRKLSLDLASMWVDVLEVRRLASNPASLDSERLSTLYSGALLEDVGVHDPEFHDWLLAERARISQLICGSVEKRLRQSLNAKSLIEAQQAAKLLLALEPAHEEAHQALMRCNMLLGEPAAAIRQYQACREALARDLDMKPSKETEALRQEICAGTLRVEPLFPIISRPSLLSTQRSRASIAVENRCAIPATEIDEVVNVAIAQGLIEILSRNRALSIVEPAPTSDTGAANGPNGSPAGAVPDYQVSLKLLRADNRIRLCAAIKRSTTSQTIWADHFDRVVGAECLHLVDECAAALANKVEMEIQLAEIARASQISSDDLTAYECVLKAIPLIFRMTPDGFSEAEKLLQQAQQTDPEESSAYVWLAFKYFLAIGQGWVNDTSAAESELRWLLRRGIELDPRNAVAFAVAGHVTSFVYHDYCTALDYFEQSLKLDPNSLFAVDLNATTLCYTGNSSEAMRSLNRYRAAAEFEPFSYFFLTTSCIAHTFAGQFDEAIRIGNRVVRENPNFKAAYRPLLVSLGHAGRLEEASGHLANLQRLQPDFSIGWFRTNYPPLQPDDSTRYIDGLRKAGVPE
jgi:DNA-binding SARP family transcriptional activator/TolB-like protein